MESPLLSVCVCTFEGAERIVDTIWSLMRQSAPAQSYEVVVVDNGSADVAPLREFVASFESSSVSLSLVVEDELGLSHARNTALHESVGEYLLFIDDDAIASPRMVERYLVAIAEHQPDVIGGNVNPSFERWPDPEFDYHYWSRWSLKLFGNRDRWLNEGEYFIGTNMGASRTLLEREGFDPDLGRRGSSLSGCEDWFLGEPRFRRRFVSGADVFHKVPEERLEERYLVKRSADQHNQLADLERRGHLLSEPSGNRMSLWRRNPIARELRVLARKLRYHFIMSRTQRRARALRERNA